MCKGKEERLSQGKEKGDLKIQVSDKRPIFLSHFPPLPAVLIKAQSFQLDLTLPLPEHRNVHAFLPF